MTIEMIETFLQIYACGNLSGASDKINLTQSAVSHRLAELENELGFALFKRQKGHKTVVLTNRGAQFLPIAQSFSSLLLDIQHISKKKLDRIPLNVACPTLILNIAFAPFLTRYITENKHVHLNLFSKHSSEMFDLLQTRTIDVGYGVQQIISPDIETIPVYTRQMYLVSTSPGRFHDGFSPYHLEPQEEVFVNWNYAPTYREWRDRYWPGNEQFVTVDSGTLVHMFLDRPDRWAVIPSDIYVALRHTYDLYCYTLSDPPPPFVCYQYTFRYLPSSRVTVIRQFCEYMSSMLKSEFTDPK